MARARHISAVAATALAAILGAGAAPVSAKTYALTNPLISHYFEYQHDA